MNKEQLFQKASKIILTDRNLIADGKSIDDILYIGATTDLIERDQELNSQHLHRYTGGKTMSERGMDYADEGFTHADEALGQIIDHFLAGKHKTPEDKKRRKVRDELNKLIDEADYQARRSTGIYYTYDDRRKDFEIKIAALKKFCKRHKITKMLVIDSRGYKF